MDTGIGFDPSGILLCVCSRLFSGVVCFMFYYITIKSPRKLFFPGVTEQARSRVVSSIKKPQ